MAKLETFVIVYRRHHRRVGPTYQLDDEAKIQFRHSDITGPLGYGNHTCWLSRWSEGGLCRWRELARWYMLGVAADTDLELFGRRKMACGVQ